MEQTLTTSSTAINPLIGVTSPLAPFLATLDVKHVLAFILGGIFFLWLIFSLVVLYHWTRYGHRSPFAIPTFLVHVVVSGGLFLMAVSAF